MRIVPIVLASGAVAVKQRDAATETIEPGAEVIHGMSQPGPPAVLRGDEYIQPWDTWIGDTVVRQFRETPHDDPVPTQEAIDLMASCPDMSALPDQFRVTMASCLGYLPTTPLRTGLWVEPIQDDSQAPLDRVAVSWTETEFELVRGPELSFHVGGTYSTAAAEELENGTLQNSDQSVSENVEPGVETTMDTPYLARTKAEIWTGENTAVFHIQNCGGRPVYTIRELVTWYPNSPVDTEACTNFGSCDGQVFIKYKINKYGDERAIVAETSNTRIFSDSLEFKDPAGNRVATLDRLGEWNPTQDCPPEGVAKDWLISFADNELAELAQPENRWVMGVFTTQMAVRDDSRGSDGLDKVSAPVMRTWAWLLIAGVIAVFVFFFGSWALQKWVAPKAYRQFLWVEHHLLPKAAYENQ